LCNPLIDAQQAGGQKKAGPFAARETTKHMTAQTIITDDGEPIFLQIEGEGPPVLLLHEWTSDAGVWKEIVRNMASSFQLIRYDARGHGSRNRRQSIQPPDITRLAQDLAAVLRHLHSTPPSRRVFVIGHSMGALTLWNYMSLEKHPPLAGICILDQSPHLITDDVWKLGVYGKFTAADNQAFVQRLQIDFPDAVLRLVANGLNNNAREAIERNARGYQRLRERLATLDPEPLIACWKSLVATDFRPCLPAIRVPSLLVYGGASNYYPVAVAHHVRAAMTGVREATGVEAELHILENADHAPHLSQRDRFLEILIPFIQTTCQSESTGRSMARD
jgi:pimeloyl-ACP methyl ester carboxylesterase